MVEEKEKKELAEEKKELVETEKDVVSIPFVQEVEIDDEFVAKLDRNIDAYRKLITIALKLTNEQDWTSQNNKPYLDCSGAEKIANPFGVQITNQRSKRYDYKDNKGAYYIWEYTATFSSAKLGRVPGIEVSGIASSRDKFFAKVTKFNSKGERVIELKPIEEVDQTMIMRKAQTNMIVNGIKRLLGLRNLDWEQLEQAGLKKEKIISIQYQDNVKKEVNRTQQDEKKKLFV